MSTSGKAKWTKYFAASDVTTRLVSKDQFVAVLTPSHDVEKVASNTQIIVPQASKYSSKYLIKFDIDRLGYVPERFVAKPISSGATEELRIKTHDFFDVCKKDVIKFNGEDVPVYREANAVGFEGWFIDQLHDRLPRYKLPPIDGRNRWFAAELAWSIQSNTKIDWGPAPENHINEYGKYLGEVVYAVQQLNKPEVESVSVPQSAKFGTVDSFVHYANGHTVGVSNKYGSGAKASFFSNILPHFTDKFLEVQDYDHGVLGEIAEYGLSCKTAKEILYHWGFYSFLGYNPEYIDCMEIYKQIADGKCPPKFIQSVTPLAEHLRVEDQVIDMLPHSLTSMFSREMAKRLNACPESMRLMDEYLQSKGFIQANLNMADWKKGNINYYVTTPDQWDLKIVGNKSAISSIKANQGMVNYQLKRKANGVQDVCSGDGS